MSRPFKLQAPSALEYQEQAALFRFAAVQERRDGRWALLNASQNGLRASSIQQAVRAKQCGMRKGYPDVFLPVAASEWHGLFIELKRRDGKPSDVSPEQQQWLDALDEQGYRAVVCYGWEHAATLLEDYLLSHKKPATTAGLCASTLSRQRG